MHITEKLIGAMVIWTLVAFLISHFIGAFLEVFIILEVVGLIVVREGLDLLTPTNLKQRIDMFIFIGVFLFIIIFIKEVMTILRII